MQWDEMTEIERWQWIIAEHRRDDRLFWYAERQHYQQREYWARAHPLLRLMIDGKMRAWDSETR